MCSARRRGRRSSGIEQVEPRVGGFDPDHGPEAEAGHGQTRHHTLLVGEPLDSDGIGTAYPRPIPKPPTIPIRMS